jgi:malonate-semialdehyde dehydrogenase (acetylating)/methylmalonate-semialdehyde dehydrogenase
VTTLTPESMLAVPQSSYGKLRNYVGGKWVESRSTDIRDVVNPATSEVVARVPMSTAEEVDEAVQSAQEAFRSWQKEPPVKRARPFFILKQLMEENLEGLSRTLVQEMGKTISDARMELRRAIEEVECACGIPSLVKGYVHDTVSPSIDLQVTNVPMGVFFMVPSFNFPALVPLEYMPYAVACGNTYVNKPSSTVPVSQVRIFELIDRCGFPPGVMNLVHGSHDVVDALMQHPLTQGFSFVGSSPVGRRLYADAAALGKRGQVAGGAKNHFVVMPDADLDAAVAGIVSSFFGAAGQRCLAGSVLVPIGDVYEPLMERLIPAAKAMKLGNGLDETVDLGPVVTQKAKTRIVGMIDTALEQGARMVLDGRHVQVDGYPDGSFVGPTILDGVAQQMTIAQEEVFGPVASVIRANDLDEALDLIHRSRFGHTGILFTSRGATARRFQHETTTGNVGINVGVAATAAYATLGGMKETGFGDLHGRSESVLFFTERRVVVSRWG